MELTGKCKKEFEKWYYHKADIPQGTGLDMPEFFNLPIEMKIGVYQLYFDSVGVEIEMIIDTYSDTGKWFVGKTDGFDFWYETRQGSWEELLSKANDIRNDQLDKPK